MPKIPKPSENIQCKIHIDEEILPLTSDMPQVKKFPLADIKGLHFPPQSA
jgi:hypothetical protein